MQSFTLLIVTIVFIVLGGTGSAARPYATQNQRSCPGSWERVDANGYFTFCLPPGMTQSNAMGIESFFREYQGSGIRFYFVYKPGDYLAYDARRDAEMRNYREVNLRIDGRKANIRTYRSHEEGHRRYEAELHIGDWQNDRVELLMSVEGNSRDALRVAHIIFRSVEFTRAGDGQLRMR